MNFNKTLLLSAFALSLSALAPQAAMATTISNFSDWGISTSDLSSSNAGVQFTTEDQNDSYLDPGYGGQDYDAEAIYTAWDNNYLYVGVMTGRAQHADDWSAGDIAFDLGSDGSFEYGLITDNYKNNQTEVTGEGSFYSVDAWNYGLWTGGGNGMQNYDPSGTSLYKSAHPTSVQSGTTTWSDSSFSYNQLNGPYGSLGGTHYFISTAIDLNQFGGLSVLLDDGFSVHWTANCNNDWIQQDVAAVPEPSILWLFSIGFISLLSSGISRRKSRQS